MTQRESHHDPEQSRDGFRLFDHGRHGGLAAGRIDVFHESLIRRHKAGGHGPVTLDMAGHVIQHPHGIDRQGKSRNGARQRDDDRVGRIPLRYMLVD